MTSELKVDKVSPATGTSTTLGDSGDTFTVPSGVTLDTSSSTLTLPSSAITGQTAITSLADTDKFLVSDASDSGNLKYVEKQYLPSGSMVLVGSVSSTGSSSGIFVNGCFSSTYINYLFTYNIDFSSDGAKARVRFTNSSNTEQTSTYKQSSIRDSGSSSASSLYNSTNYFVLNDDGQSNFNNIPLTGHMYITDPNSSSRYTAFRNFASTSDSGRNSGYEISGGHYSENTSIAGLSIYPSGGNFEAWNFKVYGIVEA